MSVLESCEKAGKAGCSCNGKELRCGCGGLMARALPEGIELKCRRCKRILLIPFPIANYGDSKDGSKF